MYQLINYTIPHILGFIAGIILLLVFLYSFWFYDNS